MTMSGIVDAAAAVVVAGTHGRPGLSRWASGNVAEGVMHVAPCSVLVVPLTREARASKMAAD